MPIRDTLLPEFDAEMVKTRKYLERVPEDRLGWQPHPKSPTLGWLAAHVANIPSWIAMTLTGDAFDVAPHDGSTPPRTPVPETQAALMDLFETQAAAARAALAVADDDVFAGTWSLLAGGNPIFTLPRLTVLRSFVFNHLIHHRGQLSVYLRVNDVPLPAIFGPTADENGL